MKQITIDLRQKRCFLHGFKKVGKDFPVFLHPQTKEAYALGRKEKVGKKHGDLNLFLIKLSLLRRFTKKRFNYKCYCTE